MTLREAEDIAYELRREAGDLMRPDLRDLLEQAAEAIEYLLAELQEAETGQIEWVGMEDAP